MLDGEKLDEFIRPVESIMRCEDFKSNFARRLSNRYTTKAPAGLKTDSPLKLKLVSNNADIGVINIPEKTHNCFEVSKVIKVEQNGEVVKPPDKAATKTAEIRSAEVTALTMEVDTLRWQLAQTEANRQMHLALLTQIVSFLNRVKEHMVCQNQEAKNRKDITSSRLLQKSFNAVDLPRSRSVLHVSKNLDYSLSPVKKLSTKKISKSISNVNGLKDSVVWNESKLSLTQDNDMSHKIVEEITRLMSLANTVLSTKIPDLAYLNNDTSIKIVPEQTTQENLQIVLKEDINASNKSLNRIEDVNSFQENAGNTTYESSNIYDEINDNYIEEKNKFSNNFVTTGSLSSCGSESNFAANKPNVKQSSLVQRRNINETKIVAEKRTYSVTNFIEDESGFSSMSSFQEIGIPIINIIPPTPCKDDSYAPRSLDILEPEDKWKSNKLELEKQTVQVFWV